MWVNSKTAKLTWQYKVAQYYQGTGSQHSVVDNPGTATKNEAPSRTGSVAGPGMETVDLISQGACTWYVTERKNKKSHKSYLVCTTCQAKGCTPNGPALYSCRICGIELGTAHFKKDTLIDFKYHKKIKDECIT